MYFIADPVYQVVFLGVLSVAAPLTAYVIGYAALSAAGHLLADLLRRYGPD